MEKLTIYFNIEPSISADKWKAMSDVEREMAFRQGKTTYSQTKSLLENNKSDELRLIRDEFLQGLVEQMNEFVRDYDSGNIPLSALGIEKKQSLLKGWEEKDYIGVCSEFTKYFKTVVQIRLGIYKFAKELDPDLGDFEYNTYDLLSELKKRSSTIHKIIEETEENLSDEEVLVAVRDALRDEIRRQKQVISINQKLSKLPSQLPQQTCQEIKTTAMSIAHAAKLKNWKPIAEELACWFAIEGVPIQIKLSIGNNLSWEDSTPPYEHLKSVLQTLGPEATFLFEYLVSLLRYEQHLTIEFDSLIKIIGWKPRTTSERNEKRYQIFHWLRVFDNITVHGKRAGTYKDTITKQIVDTSIKSKLLMLSELHYIDSNQRISNKEIAQHEQLGEGRLPVKVTLTAGPWLARFRDNDGVLPYIGDILMFSELPTGQAYGEWALSIGMTLNQLWRERARFAEVERRGEKNENTTIIYNRSFTRFGLLNMFPPLRFGVEEILNGNTPKRAQKHWKQAIEKLLQKGFISFYEDNQMISANKKLVELKEETAIELPRKGWQEIWYKQEQLDIRPGDVSKKNVIDVSKSVVAKRRNSTRRKNSATKQALITAQK